MQNRIFLAPMAGITDLPFRLICKDLGCGLVFTEMVSAKGLYYSDSKTKQLLEIDEKEIPAAVQIFGSDPYIMAKVTEQLNNSNANIIDINMGCPTSKITRNGDGSALLLNPKLVGEIIKEVCTVSTKPVTVKIRKGWDENNINAVEIAKIAEQNGAKAITVHGRTREQYYSGKADWEIIKNIKATVSIPVIGNGDVFIPQDAKDMLDYTGCDAIMVGRGALGNPWVFKRIISFLDNGYDLPVPTVKEKIQMIEKHMTMLIQYKGEYTAVREMRKHIAWYIKGIKNCSVIKDRVFKLNSPEDIIHEIRKLGSDI